MRKKIVWLVVSLLMVLSVLLVSCAPATVEEEVAPPGDEELAPPEEEEEVVVTPPELYLKTPSIKASYEYGYGTVYEIVGNRGGAGIVKVTFQKIDRYGKPIDGQQSQYIYLDEGEEKKVSFQVTELGWRYGGADVRYEVTALPAPVVYIQGKPGQDYIPGLSRIQAKVGISKGGTDFGPKAIWVMESDGSNKKRLAEGKQPSWSPDGMKIAFISDGHIWVMDSDGGGQEQLTKVKVLRFSWSPDGAKIAFVTGDIINTNLWVMDSDGSNQKKLVLQGSGPSWSPDSKKIVFVVSFDIYQHSIWVMNSDGSNQKKLVGGTQPSWSPDGKKIAFISADKKIWVMESDGGGQEQLTTMGKVRWFCWSPDGKKIAFSTSANLDDYDIWVMDSDGSNLEQLATTKFSPRPSWSPDGGKIAFLTGDFTIRDLWVMNSDGSNKIQLTTGQTNDRSPSWNPDGKKIAFMSQSLSPAFIGVEVDLMFFDEEDRILAFENIPVDVTVTLYTEKLEEYVSPEGKERFRYVKDREICAETVTIDNYKVSSRVGDESIEIPFDVYDLEDANFIEVIVHTSEGDFERSYRI